MSTAMERIAVLEKHVAELVQQNEMLAAALAMHANGINALAGVLMEMMMAQVPPARSAIDPRRAALLQ